MNAEIPTLNLNPSTGWVLYDGDCSLCNNAARCFEKLLRKHKFQLSPLQSDWVRERFALSTNEPLKEMMVLLPDNRAFGGADGIIQIARRIWWAWPLFALAQIPGAMILLRAVYRRVAANRNCFGNACELPKQNKAIDFLPLILLPASVLFVRNIFPAWVFMWLLAYAIFFGCKWLTWRRALRQTQNQKIFLSLGYLFGWVGMDAKQFLHSNQKIAGPKFAEWLLALGKIFVGIALIWIIAPRFLEMQSLLTGWIAMLGFILCLHFGSFQLLALMWRGVGINARPIMSRPLHATSLAEFWGQRWNGGFHFLANQFLFRPLLRKYGVITSTFVVFLVSGLIHDLLISLPARGGYGLPTVYFLIQGCGVVFERSDFGKQLGLGDGWRGWIFVFICTAGPAFWLFHPVFIRNVILPMLHAIGAT